MTYRTETRTVYVTEDGEEFDNEADAKGHYAYFRLEKELGPSRALTISEAIESHRGLIREILATYDDPKPAVADGWIEWKGGPRPVGPETNVEVKFRDGAVGESKAINWYWPHDSKHEWGHIVAYRVISEELPAKTPDGDGWIEWSGAECPVDPQTRVEVKFEAGQTNDSQKAGVWAWGWGGDATPGPFCIVAYRVISD